MPDARPNIILIMTDQQRGDCLSADGHPAVQTPNVDALAGPANSEGPGTLFQRAYSTCPSCIPARRVLLSGQSPARNGMTGFKGIDEWHPAHTLPGELTKAGYQTCFVGRTMHQNPTRRRYGYEQMILGSSHLADDDFALDVMHKTDYVDGFFSHGMDFNGWTARSFHMDESLHPTNWVVNEAHRFLQTRDPSCPFFLTISFYAPHPPLVPPAFYMDRYLRMDLPQPTIGEWATPPAERGLGMPVASTSVDLTGERLKSCHAGYYGLINHIDDQIHRILAPRTGGYDRSNTMIIFTSDHGEMLGDHYMFRKCEPYEGSARIPMVVWGGGQLGFNSPTRSSAPVGLEDIMPTCLDAAGVPVPDTCDGKSLVPVLRGETDCVRDFIHGEHSPCYSDRQAHQFMTDGTHKYIFRTTDGSEELFNLAADPGETHNLAGDSSAADELNTWRDRMVDKLKDRPEGFVKRGKLSPVAPADWSGLLPHVYGESAPATR